MACDRLSIILKNMKSRCYNVNNPEFKNYGARGIRVCSEWNTPGSHLGGREFKKWAFAHGYRDDLTIDRIDVNRGYSPENCQWIPRSEQYFNRTDTHYVTFNGVTKSLGKWCKELNMDYQHVRGKLRYGASVEEAFAYGIKEK